LFDEVVTELANDIAARRLTISNFHGLETDLCSASNESVCLPNEPKIQPP
jgi:hypothetical protein